MKRANIALATLAAAALCLNAVDASAQSKIKVGFMLPFTGTFAALGDGDRERLQALCSAAGRQARRPRDRILQGRRRVRAVEGGGQHQQA